MPTTAPQLVQLVVGVRPANDVRSQFIRPNSQHGTHPCTCYSKRFAGKK